MKTKDMILQAIIAHNNHDTRPFYITEDKELYRYRKDTEGKEYLQFSCSELASLPYEEVDRELEEAFYYGY